VIRVQCPRCQTRFTTSDANIGKTGQCPKCGNPIKVRPSGPQPPASPAGTSAPAPGGRAKGRAAPPEALDSRDAGTPDAAPSDSALAEASPHAARAGREPAGTQPAEAPEEAEPTAEKTVKGKSKTTAFILCILLGPLGAHRFYMGAWGYGLVIVALNLTCLGSIVFTIIDVVKLATMDQAEFQERYGETAVEPFTF